MSIIDSPEMELGIYYKKICIQAVSQVAEKEALGPYETKKYSEKFKIGWKGKEIFGTSQDLHKNRYQSFVVLYNFLLFLLLFQMIY